MELQPQFWEQVTGLVERRLDIWKCKSFAELAALPESTLEGTETIDGREVLFSTMAWHRDKDRVIIVTRASVRTTRFKTRDYDLGFVMSPQGAVRAATTEEVRSLW